VRNLFSPRSGAGRSAVLEPVIENILKRYLNNRDTRIISLLVRIAYDSGQTRSIVTNILGLQPDISPELLREIIAESNEHAKLNITRKTPQITELLPIRLTQLYTASCRWSVRVAP
jgi:hypothetical protein